MSQIRRTCLFHLWEKTISQSFKSPHVSCGDWIPKLGRPKVKIVDAVEIHVFCMPRKGGLPTAEVQVCRVDTIYLNAVVHLHVVENGSKSFNVPLIARRVCYWPLRTRCSSLTIGAEIRMDFFELFKGQFLDYFF